MDLKDYLRVVRRRWFEFVLVFSVIFVLYIFVSRTERHEYIATSVLQVGAKGYDESARNKQTFLRNHADLMALLRNNETFRDDAAADIYKKMEEVRQIEFSPDALARSRSNSNELMRKEASDWLVQRQQMTGASPEDFYEIRPKTLIGDETLQDVPHSYRYDNIRDLREARQYILEEFRIKKLEPTPEAIKTSLAGYLAGVSPSESNAALSSIQLSIKTFDKALSRLMVNEIAHFSRGIYNRFNRNRAEEEARKIDRWHDDPTKQDRIERIFNGIYALYKDLKTAQFRREEREVRKLEDQYIREFLPALRAENIVENISTIHDALKIDSLRDLGRELSEVTARYNNLKTWGPDGDASTVIFNEEAVSENIQQLTQRKNNHQAAIDMLNEELEMLDIREFHLEPAEREIFRQTSERFSLIDEQIDRERIAFEELKTRYTAQHPKVLETQANIEQLEALRNKLEDRLTRTQQAQIQYERVEKNRMIEYNQAKIGELEEELESAHVEMDKINDMSLHIEDIKDQRQTVRERINDQKVRLDSLRLQMHEEGVVDVYEFSRAAATSRRKYTETTMILTILIGLIVSIFVVYILEYMDTSIKTEHDVRRHMNLPVLSMIGKAHKEVILTELPSKDPFAEHFNTAATLVRSAAQDLGLRSFLVTSTVPQEGKTTICVDLAIALARKGLSVIVIDSDMRIPTIHEVLDIENSQGLSNILEGRTGSDDFSDLDKYLKPTTIENLRVLPSGPIPADPINLLESARMKALIEELKGKCDYLILDTPPIYNVGDTLTLASLVDATLFVVGAERVEQEQVTWAKHLLSNVNANILGVFLNMVRVPGKSYYYYYNGYKSYRSRG